MLTTQQTERFEADGFVVVDSVLSDDRVANLHERFERLFRGEFETGVEPDEVNWQEGESDPSLTRQICNGWKADKLIAETVLDERLGEALARLAGWPGARIVQDNLLWKPPGARSLGFHRDNGYLPWYKPREMFTCWMALDDTAASGGTVEFAVGSHRWSVEGDSAGQFHAPDDYRRPAREAASYIGRELDIAYIEVAAGGGSFHHGWTWHGSGANTTDRHRRALVLHCASSEACFNREGFSEGNGPIYSRYASPDDEAMPEEHFPILWMSDGYRSPGI